MIRVMNLPLSLLLPHRRITVIGIEMKNIPEARKTILRKLSELDLDVMSLMTNAALEKDPVYTMSVLIDSTGQDDTKLNEAVQQLKQVKHVISVRAVSSDIPGVAVEPFHDEYHAFNMRILIFTEKTLGGMLKGLYNTFGDKATPAFLFLIGTQPGREAARYYASLFSDKQTCLKIHERQAHALGYCRWAKITMTAPDEYEIRFDELTECEILRGFKSGYTSQWVRGVACGVFSEPFGGE
ncbi:MAG: hypothetical protein NXY59_02960 [Aigarchaeota archaeon]|nr:hypothetical protein [Candidatus Pelearchaeum maunauluense]